jgi:quercetin dioxygenase-like cupin family protein
MHAIVSCTTPNLPIIHQDDHIKVWNMELQPGATAPLHTHEYSYVFTVLVSRASRWLDPQVGIGS